MPDYSDPHARTERLAPHRWLRNARRRAPSEIYADYHDHCFRLKRSYRAHRADHKFAQCKWSPVHKLPKWEFAVKQLSEPQAVANEFRQLVMRWREETKLLSSTTDRAMHPAYQDIIGMGKPVLPLLFREMQDKGGHWFWALRHITRANPVSQEDAGRVDRMTEAWLKWGRKNRYL